MKKSLLTLFACALSASASFALEWRETLVHIDASPLDERAEAVFHFTNSGSQPVKITDVHSSCGCTVPALEKRDYAPGESGEIHAVFTFQSRVGRQAKTITVTTDEPSSEPYALNLEVVIPELFDVQPRFLLWKRDEAPQAKEIAIRVLNSRGIHPVSVQAGDKRFNASLEPSADDPKIYRVVLTPSDTANAMQTNVVVTMNLPAEHPRTVTLYGLVR